MSTEPSPITRDFLAIYRETADTVDRHASTIEGLEFDMAHAQRIQKETENKLGRLQERLQKLTKVNESLNLELANEREAHQKTKEQLNEQNKGKKEARK